MKLNKGKYKVPYVSQGNSKHKYRLGRQGIKSSPEEKDLGMLEDEKLDMTYQCELAAQNDILNQKKCGRHVKGGDSAPLIHSCETPP